MPQMSPLSWTFLTLIFILLMINIMNSLQNQQNYNQKYMNIKKKEMKMKW